MKLHRGDLTELYIWYL